MRIALVALCALLASCASASPMPKPSADAMALDAAIRSADVVFYGEAHDRRRQHADQTAILLELAELSRADGRPLLLGMEMFQRGFQGPLDDYVAGRIDEREMLRRTEYFDRWKFDYTLYAPLWRASRDHGVRIVALNADAAISRKTGREGLAALTGDERSQVAAEIDLGNAAHRERIMGMFNDGAHKMPEDRLQKLYEAMTLWDETMAESAARALAAAGTGPRMLVVAGSGHIGGGTGIPDRLARRRPGMRRVIVIGAVADAEPSVVVTRDAEQFVVTFESEDEPPAPKLGVAFDPVPRPSGLFVQSVVAGGAADEAGVLAGDVLTRLGRSYVTDMTDVRYVVDAGRTGWRVPAEVIRDGRRIPISVTLSPPPPPAPHAAPQKP